MLDHLSHNLSGTEKLNISHIFRADFSITFVPEFMVLLFIPENTKKKVNCINADDLTPN